MSGYSVQLDTWTQNCTKIGNANMLHLVVLSIGSGLPCPDQNVERIYAEVHWEMCKETIIFYCLGYIWMYLDTTTSF